MTVSLNDKYTVTEGQVYLTGIQALVRLPIDQHRRDVESGLRTGTLISGYEGSPLAGYDLTLARTGRFLKEHDIVHLPGLNEELGATAVMGSQIFQMFPGPKFDGVNGIWYGKGPGVDRSGDVFKHANFGGTGQNCGAVILAGDDPNSKSSTLPHQSEFALVSAGIPILYPSNIQEFLEFGLHAFAISRLSGCWVSLKLVTNLCDGGGVVDVAPDKPFITMPEVVIDGKPFRKIQDVTFLPPGTVEMERILFYERHEAVKAYARANRLNRIDVQTGDDRLGLVSTGKSYADLRQSLHDMGLNDEALQRLGVRILCMGMTYPIDDEIVRRFAMGLEDIIVIEEKRSFVENQLRECLYSMPNHPRIVGKYTEEGAPLFPIHGEMDADGISLVLGPRLLKLGEAPGVAARLAIIEAIKGRHYDAFMTRKPNYCSGCPHSRSTRMQEGQITGGGIGCHGMGGLIDQPMRATSYLSQMGGEGLPWVGASAFTETNHVFQNIGDGTFFHSGSQAVRACVAAGVNVTFKLLYNRAVAMTGGQEAQGGMSIPQLTHSLAAEGVKKIIVVSESPEQWRQAKFASITTVNGRDHLFSSMKELEAISGVTVLINDQQCAAEKRRQRKRGILAEPNVFALINEEVCEGCGNCGEVSNCMSLHPVETEFGLKTRIHQSSCNKDYACLDGDCPSFLTIEVEAGTGVMAKKPPVLDASAVPEPAEKAEIDGSFSIYIPGLGGTGVVTVNALLCYAALMEGKTLLNLDQTGLAQKGGAVLSNLIIADDDTVTANKVGMGTADLYLVLDALGGVLPVNLDRTYAERTVAVVTMTPNPTGEMIRDNTILFPSDASIRRSIDQCTRQDRNVYVDAGNIAEGLFGDHMAINLFILGIAYQAGLIPLKAESIEGAIELNGVAIQQNQQSFRYGRRYVYDPEAVTDLALPRERGVTEERAMMVDYLTEAYSASAAQAYEGLLERCHHLDEESQRLLAIRIGELIAFQNTAYATSYVDFILDVAARDREAYKDRTELTHAVIRNLYKLMAYKDEYEVARLHLKHTWREKLDEMFERPLNVYYNLHPPMLRALGMQRKLKLGAWFNGPMRLLTKMKIVRGTALDVFGYGKVRREERELIGWYREAIELVIERLNDTNRELSLQIATLPDAIRGYEDIKLARVAEARATMKQHLDLLTSPEYNNALPMFPSANIPA
ncbi:MAG: 2-oxoacid ferredoxin oxidoreductase subunit beta [Candidatus Entotheonella factor]|uniref:2-oxoacid ferredoxin oxidoreductase subunit beta n=1 Tax=Entotheonella factor TaxID=1429438 RepID=W4LUC2_ENTF1|nr:MAG: 2-oxoacid ferredoxin oxidoreductase subunit beta [Candidatus Entotheonella factor]